MSKIIKPLVLIYIVLSSCQPSKKDLINEADELIARFEEVGQNAEYQESSELISQAIDVERQIGDTLRLVNAIYLATRNSAISSQFDAAIKWGTEGASLSKAIDDLENEYKINNLLSWAYFETNYDLEKNLNHQKRQIFLAETLDNPEYKAHVYNNYGYDGTVAGSIHLDEALKYMHFANDYFVEKEEHEGRWYTLMNLTWIYRLKGDIKNSEKYGLLSVNQAEQDEDRHAIIEACTNLAETYLTIGQVESSKSLYEKAKEWSEEKTDRDKFVFDVYYAGFLSAIDKKQEAIATLERAIEFLETSEVFYEMLGRIRLAQLYTQSERNAEAEAQLMKIRDPRHEYFAFEVKAMAEKLAERMGMDADVSGVIRRAEEIGAQTVVDRLMD